MKIYVAFANEYSDREIVSLHYTKAEAEKASRTANALLTFTHRDVDVEEHTVEGQP